MSDFAAQCTDFDVIVAEPALTKVIGAINQDVK